MSNHADERSQTLKMPLSYCPEHNLPYLCYCSHEKCDSKIRVCPTCKNVHSDHLKFLTQKKQVVEDLRKGLKRCLDKIEEYDLRSVQLTKLMKVARQKANKQYEEMEIKLIDQMKDDKYILEEKVIKMQQIATKIKEKQKAKTYFAKLQQHSLVNLRIKLSTIEGMKNFKQKNEKLRELTSKSSTEEIHKLYEDFYSRRKDFNDFLHNNTTFKVGQIIALKNSKRLNDNKELKKDKLNKDQKIQREMEEKENKVKNGRRDKPRAKTTLDFGDGIINGILNFLNF